MKLISFAKGVSTISIFPRERRGLKPVQFVKKESDADAIHVDFMQVGKDKKKALDQYGSYNAPSCSRNID